MNAAKPVPRVPEVFDSCRIPPTAMLGAPLRGRSDVLLRPRGAGRSATHVTCSDQPGCEVPAHIDLAFDPVTSQSAIGGGPENSAFPSVPAPPMRLIAIDPAGRVTAGSITPVRTSPIVHELLDVEAMVGGRTGNVELDIPSTVDLRRDVARTRDPASGRVRRLRQPPSRRPETSATASPVPWNGRHPAACPTRVRGRSAGPVFQISFSSSVP